MKLRTKFAAFALMLGAGTVTTIGLAAGERPTHVASGNLEASVNAGFAPTKLSRTKPSPVSLVFSARLMTADGAPVPAVNRVAFETDQHLNLELNGVPRCSPEQLQGTEASSAARACQPAVIGSGFASVEIRPGGTVRRPISEGPEFLVFNGGTKNGVTTLLVHVHFPELASASMVFPVKVKETEKGGFGLSWTARIPVAPGGDGSFTTFTVRLQKGLAATCPDGHLLARGTASFAGGKQLWARLSRDCR